jgi:hypothetical protein
MLRTVAAVTAALFLAVSAAPAFADCSADIPNVEAAVAKLKAGADKTKAEGDIKLAKKYAGLKNEDKCVSYLNYAKKHVKM